MSDDGLELIPPWGTRVDFEFDARLVCTLAPGTEFPYDGGVLIVGTLGAFLYLDDSSGQLSLGFPIPAEAGKHSLYRLREEDPPMRGVPLEAPAP